MNYYGKVVIESAEFDKLDAMLSLSNKYSSDYEKDSEVKVIQVSFNNGFVGEITLYNTKTPYLEAVLFDDGRNEICTFEMVNSLKEPLKVKTEENNGFLIEIKKQYSETIQVSLDELNEMEEVLKIEEDHSKDYHEDDLINSYVTTFEDECFAKVNIYNTDSPYIEAVLFDKNGQEIAYSDVLDSVKEEFEMETDSEIYLVKLVAIEELEPAV